MKKSLSLIIVAVSLVGASMNAQSFEFDDKKLYAGGGLGYSNPSNSAYDNAIGFQFFAGYDLNDDVEIGDKIGLSAELGYEASGNFKYNACNFVFCSSASYNQNGVFATALADYALNDKMKALARFGFGNGLVFGIGGQYKVDDKISARLEYVTHTNYSSIQTNIVYDL